MKVHQKIKMILKYLMEETGSVFVRKTIKIKFVKEIRSNLLSF